MSDDAPETVEMVTVAKTSRDKVPHEFLCSACAHRIHEKCERRCQHCQTVCVCMCGRWALPLPTPPAEATPVAGSEAV